VFFLRKLKLIGAYFFHSYSFENSFPKFHNITFSGVWKRHSIMILTYKIKVPETSAEPRSTASVGWPWWRICARGKVCREQNKQTHTRRQKTGRLEMCVCVYAYVAVNLATHTQILSKGGHFGFYGRNTLLFPP